MKKYILLLIIPFLSFGQESSHNWKINIGGTFMFPFSQVFEDEEFPEYLKNDFKTRVGIVCQVSHIFRLNQKLAYSPAITYYLISNNSEDLLGNFSRNYKGKRHYFSFVNNIEYNINHKLSASIGFAFDKLFKESEIGEMSVTNLDYYDSPDADPDLVTGYTDFTIDNELTSLNMGFYLSLPININYVIYESLNYNISLYTSIKVPFYFSENSSDFGEISKTWQQRNLAVNRNLTFGLAITF